MHVFNNYSLVFHEFLEMFSFLLVEVLVKAQILISEITHTVEAFPNV